MTMPGESFEQYMARGPRETKDANGTINEDYLRWLTNANRAQVQQPDGTWRDTVTGYNAGHYAAYGGGGVGAAAGPRDVGNPLPGSAGGGSAPTSGATGTGSAYAMLQRVLDDYGLGSLSGQVQQWLVQGLSEPEVLQRMRETSEFKTRFPAIAERQRKGLAPISPGEYVAYENAARQMMRAAGLPNGFYDSSEDFTRFLVNDLSPTELGDRITMASNAAFKMPKEDRDALAAWGMGPGDLTAFWLDPDKAQPLLERKYAAAQLAGTAQRTSFGSLTEQTATELATLGVTQQQAEQGFSTLANSRELFQSLDSTEDTIDQGAQLGAAFGGNANAQRRIEQRKRKREATFSGGGGYASSQQGLVGLGDVE